METCSICCMISDYTDISCQIPSNTTDRSCVTHAPMSNPANSVSSDPISTSPSDPLTQAHFGSFPAFPPEPLARFHFVTQMLPMAALAVIFLRHKHNIICVKVVHVAYQPMLAKIIS